MDDTSRERWEILVDKSFQENTIKYKPGDSVVIRANDIGFAMSLVQRGRELIAKYSPRG